MCFISFPIGSSPHAWGQDVDGKRGIPTTRFIPTCVGTGLENLCQRRALGRFIPTCVGTGRAIFRGVEPDQVHPHMRGDRKLQLKQIAMRSGSSPHAWGQDRPAPARAPPGRFIPTCVGTGVIYTRTGLIGEVHPHMRGDRDAWFNLGIPLRGSSPHAWGQGRESCSNSLFHPVHPHMRGDRAPRAWH